jgi:MSHA biogenesis protein MshJ
MNRKLAHAFLHRWKDQLNDKVKHFNGLSRRERSLVLIMGIVGISLGGYSLWIEPELQRQHTQETQLAQLADHQQKVQALLQSTLAEPDPSNIQQQQLQHLQRELSQVNEKLVQTGQTLLPPEQIPLLLENLLSRSRGLQLVNLRKLPPTPLSEHVASGAVASGLFKQGIEIQVEGRYADLLSYVESLEQLPQHLLWQNITLEVQTPPKSLLTLTLYTLSTDLTWLSL